MTNYFYKPHHSNVQVILHSKFFNYIYMYVCVRNIFQMNLIFVQIASILDPFDYNF